MTAKHRESTRPRAPGRIGDALGEFLRENGLDLKLRHARVVRGWDTVLGKNAALARAVRFQAGELLVEVQSAALFSELENFTGDDYRCALNRLLGSEQVARVKFQLKR